MDTRTSWPALLNALLAGESLTPDEAAWAMNEIMSGEATDAQIAGFAVALRAKGETVGEVSGMVEVMLSHATPLEVPGPVVDVVGTGGDRAHTVNISTMGAIVAAAAGARVVKHGNRAASSACGAADLLDALGVVLDVPPEGAAQTLETTGIAFCFAPAYHPAMRYAVGPRREMAVPTVFNFLGPLANPARPQAQAVGVFDTRMAGVMAGVLAARGCSSLVFRGDDGLDELTTTATSSVWIVRDGTVSQTTFDPAGIGIPRAGTSDLRGADAQHNARVTREVMGGAKGPVRDVVCLSAAAGLVALDGAPEPGELSDALRGGYERAGAAIDSGAALALLDRWVETTQRF